MAQPTPQLLPFLIALPLIAWRLYRRIRSSIGRQKLSKVRPWITLTLFPILFVLIGFAALEYPVSLLGLAGGACVGAALGVYGLKKTLFENTPQGMFYTPNAHLGIALSVVFAARVVYRMYEQFSLGPGMQPGPTDFARSPLTLAIFGLLAGYYVAYAIGLIRWRLRETKSAATISPHPAP
jgi:hypothetical protein